MTFSKFSPFFIISLLKDPNKRIIYSSDGFKYVNDSLSIKFERESNYWSVFICQSDVVLNNGEIRFVTNRSHHYMPTEYVIPLLNPYKDYRSANILKDIINNINKYYSLNEMLRDLNLKKENLINLRVGGTYKNCDVMYAELRCDCDEVLTIKGLSNNRNKKAYKSYNYTCVAKKYIINEIS